MENILELLRSGNFEDAKAQISAMEQRLAEEPSVRARLALQGQVSKLKEAYHNSAPRDTPHFTTAPRNSAELALPAISDDCKKVHYSNLSSSKIAKIALEEVKIENCRSIQTECITCKGSAVLINVRDSEVQVSAQQIRLINCTNIVLRAHSGTGIFLQDSTGISIAALPDANDAQNRYKTVKDFSCPFKSQNYSFI